MAGKKGMKHYSLEFRRKIADLHFNGTTFRQIEFEYGVSETQTKLWCKWIRENGEPRQITGKKKRGRPKHSEENTEEKIKRLEMENTLLKKFHELLREEHKRK